MAEMIRREPIELAPLHLGNWLVGQDELTRYADAAGANDPIHTGRGPMPSGWTGGTIAQGMLVLAVMAERLVDAMPSPEAFYPGGSVDVRFRAPVAPGDHVAFEALPAADRVAGPNLVAYRLSAAVSGRVVIDGTALVPESALAPRRE